METKKVLFWEHLDGIFQTSVSLTDREAWEGGDFCPSVISQETKISDVDPLGAGIIV